MRIRRILTICTLVLLIKTGRTPLHSSIALSNNYDVTRILIDNGGDLHNCNVEGRTPLHTFWSPVLERTLQCHGTLIDVSTRDHRGMRILHYLAWSSKTSRETFSKYYEISNLAFTAVDEDGRSVLHLAAQRGNVSIIEYILNTTKVTMINQRDQEGRSALHYAVENKRAPATIALLVSHGADVHARDSEGHSALYHAAKLNRLAAIHDLTSLGMAHGRPATDPSFMHPGEYPVQRNTRAVSGVLESKKCVPREWRSTALARLQLPALLSSPQISYGSITRRWRHSLRTLKHCISQLCDCVTWVTATHYVAVIMVLSILCVSLVALQLFNCYRN